MGKLEAEDSAQDEPPATIEQLSSTFKYKKHLESIRTDHLDNALKSVQERHHSEELCLRNLIAETWIWIFFLRRCVGISIR